jgi:hypothetical protein
VYHRSPRSGPYAGSERGGNANPKPQQLSNLRTKSECTTNTGYHLKQQRERCDFVLSHPCGGNKYVARTGHLH